MDEADTNNDGKTFAYISYTKIRENALIMGRILLSILSIYIFINIFYKLIFFLFLFLFRQTFFQRVQEHCQVGGGRAQGHREVRYRWSQGL